ncbi:MAG: serine/threonine-protein kinase [Bdellovibrionota bacterium]
MPGGRGQNCQPLQHPNIVEVLDLGSVGTDFYLTMEWVNGKSLEKVFRALKDKRKFLSRPFLLYILREVAKGLHFAHEAKDSSGRPIDIVHCDISAQNILISYEGDVLLSDFGIATAEKSQQQALAEVVLGKLSYMAPEQLARKGFDRRADIYSFGVLMFEGLTYRKPFRSKNVHELQQAIMKQEPDLSHPNIQNNPKLARYIASTLSKDVHQRPSSLESFLEFTKHEEVADKEQLKQLMSALFAQEKKNEAITRSLAVSALAEKNEHEMTSLLGVEEEWGDEESPKEKTEMISINPPNDVTRIAQKSVDAIGRVSLKQKSVLQKVENPVISEEVSTNNHLHVQKTSEMVSYSQPSVSDLLEESIEASLEHTDDNTESSLNELQDLGMDYPEGQVEVTMMDDSMDDLKEDIRKNLTQPMKSPIFSRTDKKIQPDISHKIERPTSLAAVPLSEKEQKKVSVESSGEEITLQIRITPSMLKKAGFFLFFVLIGFCLPYIYQFLGSFQSTNIPIQEFQMYVSIEDYEPDISSQKEYSSNFFIEETWIKPIQHFFSQEYVKYTKQETSPYTFVVKNISVKQSSLPEEESLLSLFSLQEPFATLNGIHRAGLDSDLRHQAKIFLHFYPKKATESFRYPIDWTNKRPTHSGIVFLPIDDFQIQKQQVFIVHEMLHALGAKDQFDKKGAPLVPKGLAQPRKKPLYPQELGEVMSRVIATSETEWRPIESLQQAAIGPYTAKEIGWITSEQWKEMN